MGPRQELVDPRGGMAGGKGFQGTIRARGARLADEAVGIWKRPFLPDRVLEPYWTPRAGAGRYSIECTFDSNVLI